MPPLNQSLWALLISSLTAFIGWGMVHVSARFERDRKQRHTERDGPSQITQIRVRCSRPPNTRLSEEDGRIGPSRLDHRLATFFGPDPGKVTKEASRESLASPNGATVQITRLAWFPLGRLADFSYV